jgi:hypothetical protein
MALRQLRYFSLMGNREDKDGKSVTLALYPTFPIPVFRIVYGRISGYVVSTVTQRLC